MDGHNAFTVAKVTWAKNWHKKSLNFLWIIMDMFFFNIYIWWEESPPTLILSYPFIIEYTLNSGTLVHNTIMSCLRCCLVWFSKLEQKGLMEFTSSFDLTFFYDYATPSKVVLWLASIFSGIILCVLVSKLICSLVLCEFYVAS